MSENMKGVLSGQLDTFSRQFTLETIMPAVKEVLIDISSDSAKLNAELGAASKSAGTLRTNILGLSAATGVASKDFTKITAASSAYHKILSSSLNKSVVYFSKATNSSADSTTKLALSLNTLSKTSALATTRIFETINQAQKSYGLTGEQIDKVNDSLIKYAYSLDISDGSVVKATANISRFMSELTATGATVDEVGSLIDKLLDPTKATASIALFSKLGYTMQDLTVGDPTDKLMSALPKLKSLSNEILSNNNRFAQQSMAEVYGLSLEDVHRFGAMTIRDMNKVQMTSLEAARNQTLTLLSSLETGKNMAMNGIAKMFSGVYSGLSSSAQESVNNLIRNPIAITEVAGIFAVALWKISGLMATKAFALAGRSMGNEFNRASGINELTRASALRAGSRNKMKSVAENSNDIDNMRDNSLFEGDGNLFQRFRGSRTFKTLKKESTKDPSRTSNTDRDPKVAAQSIFELLKTKSAKEYDIEGMKKQISGMNQSSYKNTLMGATKDLEDSIRISKDSLLKRAFKSYGDIDGNIAAKVKTQEDLYAKAQDELRNLKAGANRKDTEMKVSKAQKELVAARAQLKIVEKETIEAADNKTKKELNRYKKDTDKAIREYEKVIRTGETTRGGRIANNLMIGAKGAAKGAVAGLATMGVAALVPILLNMLTEVKGFTELTTNIFGLVSKVVSPVLKLVEPWIAKANKAMENLLGDTGKIVSQGEEAILVDKLSNLDISTIQLRQLDYNMINAKKTEEFQAQLLSATKKTVNYAKSSSETGYILASASPKEETK